ncbi:MAG: leucine-rich repeat domain-containing protein [Bacteroidaceae bacterium]|nr:leucine-rich repeat domain-containing protein [Bacteroidaceae bacterium]
MKKLYYSLTALLFVMAGCSNNDFLDNEGTHAPVAKSRTITSITATMEDDADTRTQLLDGKKVVWTQYDRISVISDEGEMSNYEISDGIGEATATFTGEPVEGSTFWAISPSAWDLDFETKTAGIYWEYSNNVVFGNDGNGVTHSIPMFANEGTDGKFSFKQLGGILHFQITGTGRLVYVWLRSNDGMKFPYHWSINYTADDPLATLTKDDNYSMGSDFIISKPGDEIQLSDTPTDVYFVLPAGMTFAEGFDLSFTIETEENGIYYQDEIHKRSDKPVTVNRGLVKHFPKYDLTEQKEENIRKMAAPLLALMEANVDTWTYPDGLSDDRKWSVSNPIENWYGVITMNGQIMALNLENYGITTLPVEFFNMPELIYLYLNNNQISSVPEEIKNLSKLEELYLSGNSLTAFPEGVLGLTNLIAVDLGNNQIEGTIPEALGNMATLTWVSLSYNNFTGTVPRGFFQNQNLEDLYVQMNKLTDELIWDDVYGTHGWNNLVLNPQQDGYGIVVVQTNGLGTLSGLGIAKQSVRAEARKSENGWILTFTNLKPDGVTEESDELKAIDNLVVWINQGLVGDSVTEGQFPGTDFNAVISDANGNPLWRYVIEGAPSDGLLNIDHTDDGVYDVKLVMFVQSVSSLEIKNVSFEWNGEIAIIPD